MMRLSDRGLSVAGAAEAVAEAFRTQFLNTDGLMSRQNPPTGRTLFDNLDDVAPFLLYFGHADFLLGQISRLSLDSFERLLAHGNIIYSYKIDEYLGGLNAIFRATGSRHAFELLVDAVEKCQKYFFSSPDRFSETYDLYSGEKSPYFSPWSAGLLETFLEVDLPNFRLVESVSAALQHWTTHPYFVRNALFPFRGAYDERRLRSDEANARALRWCGEPPARGAVEGWRNIVAGIGPVYLLRRANYRRLRSGHWSQLMKSNTTPVFALLALYEKEASQFCVDAVCKWISGVTMHMVGDQGEVHSAWYPDGSRGVTSLVASFILMDVLCEAYRVLSGPREWLDLAEKIADHQLNRRWPNGLIPMFPGAEWDHLDGQIDFAIALRRLAEIGGRATLREESFALAENALALHWSGGGFSTHLNRSGNVLKLPFNTIDPKYNGLALKGLIHLAERNGLIYDSPSLADLFKDR